MHPFEASIPNIGAASVQPLRTRDTTSLLAALAACKPPFDASVSAELLALAFAHEEPAVRKKAMTLATKHIPDTPQFKAAYKSLSNAIPRAVDERVRAFDHPYRLDIARALLFHRQRAETLAFELDAQVRGAILDIAVDNAKREGEAQLKLGEVYWRWTGSSGTVLSFDHRALTPALVAEIAERRARHPFDGLSLHGGSLTDLPGELATTAPWLRSLSLAANSFTTLPDVLWTLEHLEELELWGNDLVDVPPDIARLTKLRRLDLGNMKRMKELPTAVCALERLEWLRIGNGSIRTLPEAIAGMTSLRELDMQGAPISRLPAALARLPKLEQVNVRWTKLASDTIANLEAAGIKVER